MYGWRASLIWFSGYGSFQVSCIYLLLRVFVSSFLFVFLFVCMLVVVVVYELSSSPDPYIVMTSTWTAIDSSEGRNNYLDIASSPRSINPILSLALDYYDGVVVDNMYASDKVHQTKRTYYSQWHNLCCVPSVLVSIKCCCCCCC